MSNEEVVYPHQAECAEWLEKVFAALGENHPLVAEMPKVMEGIGKTHVVVPSPENMTEDMVDASRSLLLYTDTFSTTDAPRIRKMISARKWVRRHLPTWFNEEQGHLTKAGRAILAYDLTVKAALYPPAPEEQYFPETKPTQGRLDFPSKDGFELTLSYEGHELVISRVYEDLWNRVDHGDVLDIQINRHQLPGQWRKMFKTRAIEISGRLSKTPDDGEIVLNNPKVRIALKEAFQGKVIEKVVWAAKVSK